MKESQFIYDQIFKGIRKIHGIGIKDIHNLVTTFYDGMGILINRL